MTGGLLAQELLDGGADLDVERLGRVGKVADGEREDAAFGAKDGTVAEVAGDRRGVEGGGHDDDAERGALLLQALEQGEGEVALEVALVELVEDDGVDAVEGGIGEQAAGEDAVGDEAEARAWAVTSSKRT